MTRFQTYPQWKRTQVPPHRHLLAWGCTLVGLAILAAGVAFGGP